MKVSGTFVVGSVAAGAGADSWKLGSGSGSVPEGSGMRGTVSGSVVVGS